MSITDELRKWLKSLYTPNSATVKDEGEHIADRIDAKHEEAIASMMNDALYHANDKDMADLGWVKLPKDADGEPIHVGDEMCGYGWPNGGVYCRAIVNEVTILVGPQDGAYRGWLMWAANECRHHHAPTVEDALREFYVRAVRGKEAHAEDVDEGVLAEYAAKLRLAGDGE